MAFMKLPRASFGVGVSAMVVSNLFFSLMAILIRLDPATNALDASFYRFAVGIALVATLAFLGKTHLRFHDVRGLLWRGIVGGLSVVLFYLPINTIGLGKTSLIQYTYPFFAILFSAVLLKEKITPWAWVLTAVALSGLVLLNLPSLTSGKMDWMIAAAWGSAVASGLAVTYVKKLTKTETSSAIFLAQSLGGFWIILIPANLTPSPWGWVPAFLLLGIGLTAAVGQLIMTWSYRSVDVSTGSLLGTMIPVLNVAAGILFFKESFNLMEAIGATLTLSACFLLVAVQWDRNKAKVLESKGIRD
jgi:drug/metabolite transporter (DMT)-like permease